MVAIMATAVAAATPRATMAATKVATKAAAQAATTSAQTSCDVGCVSVTNRRLEVVEVPTELLAHIATHATVHQHCGKIPVCVLQATANSHK